MSAQIKAVAVVKCGICKTVNTFEDVAQDSREIHLDWNFPTRCVGCGDYWKAYHKIPDDCEKSYTETPHEETT